ncbi:hypothetical protein GCM10023189_49270 [Nibrella saemangeumensis]|uniref:Uncharacterized protein n=1 Tax=Nibrella saemangeumensis TaxID=1084526 RepID=A0ABP8NJS7_9BACT
MGVVVRESAEIMTRELRVVMKEVDRSAAGERSHSCTITMVPLDRKVWAVTQVVDRPMHITTSISFIANEFNSP